MQFSTIQSSCRRKRPRTPAARGASLLLPLAISLLIGSVRADEVRTSDGRVLVGSVKKVGTSLRVHTLDGVVVISSADVVRIRTDAQLREELSRLAADRSGSAFDSLQLAQAARGWGLHREMWNHLDRCLGTARRSSPQRARLRAFLRDLEAEVLPRKWRKTPTEIRVRELLYRIKPGAPLGIAAAVEEILAAEPNAAKHLRKRARSASRPAQRVVAARALASSGIDGGDRFLYRTAILDHSADARSSAAIAVRERGETRAAVRYLAPGLIHGHPQVRVRTAETFGHMGNQAAVDLLVSAGPNAGTPPKSEAGGAGVRAHMSIVTQQAYIRDFDVEVAQASFIADPKVSVLQSGVVLDVTVHAVVKHRTEIVRAYRGALRHLMGSDPGHDPKRWATWLAERRQPR